MSAETLRYGGAAGLVVPIGWLWEPPRNRERRPVRNRDSIPQQMDTRIWSADGNLHEPALASAVIQGFDQDLLMGR